MNPIRRAAAAAAAATLLALSVSACGDDGDSNAGDSPTDASQDDFCDAWTDAFEKLAGAGEKPSEDDWEAFQDKVKDLGDVGTPDDIDDDARDGFETFVDIVVDSDYDDAKDFAKGLPGASAKEQANAEGFVTYAITTCTEVPEQ